MADTLSVLYGTTENRNDKGFAASGLDTLQFSPICMNLAKGNKTYLYLYVCTHAFNARIHHFRRRHIRNASNL